MKDKVSKLSLVLTATASMALGACMMYYKNYKSIEFAKKYPLILETQDFMKYSDAGLPSNVDTAAQINSFLELYSDKYTFYENVDTASEEFVVENVNGSPTALGTGFEISFNSKNQLYFSNVIDGMPAYSQGLRIGDIVLSINGKEIEKYVDAQNLKGKAGTKIDLIILHEGEKKNLTLTRKSDTEAAVNIAHEMKGETLWLKYNHFGQWSAPEFENVVLNNKYDSLIIDLRNNSGGEMNIAVEIADYFVEDNEVVLNYYNGRKSVYSTQNGVEINVPTVLLVNSATASAAEVFAGLLKQGTDTTIIGEKTFGKGVFQHEGFFRGGVVRYTAGTFTVGDWPCWQGVGIAPDIEVKMDPDLIGTDDDIQLQKALEILG